MSFKKVSVLTCDICDAEFYGPQQGNNGGHDKSFLVQESIASGWYVLDSREGDKNICSDACLLLYAKEPGTFAGVGSDGVDYLGPDR